jgi:WD40 repeat protein
VAFTPDGVRVVSAGSDGTVRLWNVATGKLVRTFRWGGPSYHGDERVSRTLTCLSLDPEGRTAIAGDLGGRIVLVDLAGERPLRAVDTGGSSIFAVATGASGASALVGTQDGALSLWDTDTGRRLWARPSDSGPVSMLATDTRGRIVVVSRSGRAIEIRETTEGSLRTTFPAHREAVTGTALFRDGSRFVSAGRDGKLRIWETATGKLLNPTEDDGEAHELPVRALAVSPDGTRFAAGGGGGRILLQTIPGGATTRTLSAHEGGVRALVFSPDGESLLSGGDDGLVRLWRIPSGELVWSSRGHERAVRSVAFGPKGIRVASGGADGTARIWRASDGLLERTLRGHGVAVAAVAFADGGSRLVSGDRGGNLLIWDTASGAPRGEKYVTEVAFLSFDSSGRLLLAPSVAFDHPDPGLHLWRLEAKSWRTLKVPGERWTYRLAVLSADGSRVFEAAGRTLRLWDVKTGAVLRTLEDSEPEAEGPTGVVTAIAASADGRHVVTAYEDRSVKLWRP